MNYNISEYFKRIWKWRWLLLLCPLLAAATTYWASRQQSEIYQTRTTLMVGQILQKSTPTGNDFVAISQLAQSYAAMAGHQPILQATVESLQLSLTWQALGQQVHVTPIAGTQLLEILVEDTSPERAVAIADEIARQLIRQSPTSPDNRQRQERAVFIQKQLDDLEKGISLAQTRANRMKAELDAALSAAEIQRLQHEINTLEGLINNWQANYASLLAFLTGGDSPNYLSVIEPAQLPITPIKPDLFTNVLLATGISFVLALGGALLLDHLDDTVTAASVEQELGLPLMGSIVRLKGSDSLQKLISRQGWASAGAEAYRLLRTNIQFAAVDQPLTSILITSAQAGEGKSLTAANLGLIMAQANLKTIIVDADLRQPALHQLFQAPQAPGLTDWLRSPNLAPAALLQSTPFENLRLLTSGAPPPNPAELVGSQKMPALIRRLESLADIVIFDSPPVLPATDSSVLASRLKGTLLVTWSERTRLTALKMTLARLDLAGAQLLGAVLNQVSKPDHFTEYYRISGPEEKSALRSTVDSIKRIG